MLLDLGVGQFAPQHFQAVERPFLIQPHQPRIARDIGGKDGGKTAGSGHFVAPSDCLDRALRRNRS
jgi:hypothetical protein